ncbi:hypothetical protein [Moraxella macacae]|uniref:hypothetical protein n=1 Tax=Moraxella macacae TaxID=765840 RepID=UPI000317B095|nr:hypothetical protein [Moraxella macacae]
MPLSLNSIGTGELFTQRQALPHQLTPVGVLVSPLIFIAKLIAWFSRTSFYA